MFLKAPLVYARTHLLDFRTQFIASPEDFNAESVEWARNHILALTAPSLTYRLGESDQWWAVFSNHRHVVTGVLCRAATVSEDCNTDVVGRRLFAFLGLVQERSAARVPAMNIQSFVPLYQYVRDRWFESSSEALGAARRFGYTESPMTEAVLTQGSCQLKYLHRLSKKEFR